MSFASIPNSTLIDSDEEYLFISAEGLKQLSEKKVDMNGTKDILWTTDYTHELPIKIKKKGPGSEVPVTLLDFFRKVLTEIPNNSALKVKRKNQWQTWTYAQYYADCCSFAKGLIALGLTPYSSVNIIGFNAPEWFITFYGSIFGNYLPVGIYTTNNADGCRYVSLHSEAEIIVAEDKIQLKKYLEIWKDLPKLKYILLYNDVIPKDLPPEYKDKVMLFTEFLKLGNDSNPKNPDDFLETRMKKQKPGNCCTLVYTSGTTGPPKAVMISHDNYTWTAAVARYNKNDPLEFGKERLITYLPLSHVAAQIVDIVRTLYYGCEVYFADNKALQGSILETLKEVRPTIFFSVPRLWEKIEEKMKLMGAQNGFIKRRLANWAKSIGKAGTFAELNELQTPFDQAKFLIFGAAPMSHSTREYFLSLNMFLYNGYGMSECSGPQTKCDPQNFKEFDAHALSSCGRKIEGTDMIIVNPDKDGNGEICYKGRNRFMGYYKNETETLNTIDAQGYLHSGDVGKMDERGNLSITGRIKELIITAGGENIAPIPIEDGIKEALPFVSNAIVIGDKRKYLIILLTLKYTLDKDGKLTDQFSEEALRHLQAIGAKARNYETALKDDVLKKFINTEIKKVNEKAISKPHHIRKWVFIPGDFTFDGGELTPTLKLKRKQLSEKKIDMNGAKDIVWTTDYTHELPIKIKKKGPGSEVPVTLLDFFRKVLTEIPNNTALKVKRNNQWQTWTYAQYYADCCAFAKGLIAVGLTPYSSVNIIGFNAPEWFITFYGSIFGNYLPVGIYTTNNADACKYVSLHSEAEMIVAEDKIQLKKYLKIWKDLPRLKYILLYNDVVPKDLPPEYRDKVMLFTEFLKLGNESNPKNPDDFLETRMKKQKPGNCCTLVYTSGTTGPPKAVMISHDNYTWTSTASLYRYRDQIAFGKERLVSFLPLSHVAAQIIDIIGSLNMGLEVYFAENTALQGSILETLKEVRPTFFFSVPRLWEKIEEKMKLMGAQNGFVKKGLANWAKSMGKPGTFAELNNLPTPFCFSVAKKIIYQNIKKALGLDQAKFLIFGAAPMANSTREYFLSLNMFLINGYGMSECSGPQTTSDPRNFKDFDAHALASCGRKIEGTDMMLFDLDKHGNGEICYKGRNRFMGYYKNEIDTLNTIDAQGYLHSGDVGKIDERGNLSITGRIKELIITAGGENIAPVLIENEVKEALPFVSNAMVIGDKRKYLIILLTLKYAVDKDGKLTDQLSEEALKLLQAIGAKATSYETAQKDDVLKKFINTEIKKANERAISRAHHVRKWVFIPGDFTVDGGELTPTLKLKRRVTADKYTEIIESLYQDPKL